jgi:flagellar biosynthetic protein FliP
MNVSFLPLYILLAIMGLALIAWMTYRHKTGGKGWAFLKKKADISLQSMAAVDTQHRLSVARWGEQEYLLFHGPHGAFLVDKRAHIPEDKEGRTDRVKKEPDFFEVPEAEKPRRRSTAKEIMGWIGVFSLMGLGGAWAQSVTFDMGGAGGSLTTRLFQFGALITVLTLAPSLLMMVTSFTRLVVVFSFLRSAIGLQQSPPNVVFISLALFMSFFIMAPTFEASYQEGIKPYLEEQLPEEQAWDKAAAPFRTFMLREVREKDLLLFAQIAKIEKLEKPEVTPLKILVPAFMISELRRAFEIGFLLFLPFVLIDIVVASVLMSMGMMMLPPMMISLPFKLIFFVLVDGWYLLVGSLVKGFS